MANCFSGEVSGFLCSSCCGNRDDVAHCVVRHAQEELHSFIRQVSPVLFNVEQMGHSEFSEATGTTLTNLEVQSTLNACSLPFTAIMSTLKITSPLLSCRRKNIYISYFRFHDCTPSTASRNIQAGSGRVKADFLAPSRRPTHRLTGFTNMIKYRLTLRFNIGPE